MRNLLIFSVLTAASAAPAFAQEVAVSGNVALTTDYAFRGISQSDESPAVQGGFDAAFGDSGVYAGAWASNINFGTGGANLELDLYGGYKFAVGGIAMDVGVIGYFYPGASDDTAELDYYEAYVKPSFALTEQFTLGELQSCCEQLLGRRLDKSSFRRRIADRELVEPVAGAMRTGANRPAQIYRLLAD